VRWTDGGWIVEVSGDHNHVVAGLPKDQQAKGLGERDKEIIRELFTKDPCLDSCDVNAHFNGLGKTIDGDQTARFIQTLKSMNKANTPKETIGAILQKVKALMTIPPDSLRNLDDVAIIQTPVKGARVDIFVTTRRLVSILVNCDTLYVDATHDVTSMHLKAVTFNVMDAKHRVHTCAITVALTEDLAAYANTFAILKKLALDLFHVDWQPRFVVADGMSGLENVFQSADGATTRIMCYFHFIKLMHTKLTNQKQKWNLAFHIDILRRCSSRELFKSCFDHFKLIWDDQTELVESMDKYVRDEKEQSCWARARCARDEIRRSYVNIAETAHSVFKRAMSKKLKTNSYVKLLDDLAGSYMEGYSIKRRDDSAEVFQNISMSSFNSRLLTTDAFSLQSIGMKPNGLDIDVEDSAGRNLWSRDIDDLSSTGCLICVQ
jgi:ribosome-binding protein aMBF1 (putative translation factor)